MIPMFYRSDRYGTKKIIVAIFLMIFLHDVPSLLFGNRSTFSFGLALSSSASQIKTKLDAYCCIHCDPPLPARMKKAQPPVSLGAAVPFNVYSINSGFTFNTDVINPGNNSSRSSVRNE